MREHYCTITKYIFHQNCKLHSVECVHSSSALDILSLYCVITPAANRTSCHSTVCSLRQCTSHPVTLQLVHCSSALGTLSLYSVFALPMNFRSCIQSLLYTNQSKFISCNSTVSSLQQCTWHPVTLHYVHSSSALGTISL
jgi:hypothetical protein